MAPREGTNTELDSVSVTQPSRGFPPLVSPLPRHVFCETTDVLELGRFFNRKGGMQQGLFYLFPLKGMEPQTAQSRD